jgi:hypothetical protein
VINSTAQMRTEAVSGNQIQPLSGKDCKNPRSNNLNELKKMIRERS